MGIDFTENMLILGEKIISKNSKNNLGSNQFPQILQKVVGRVRELIPFPHTCYLPELASHISGLSKSNELP